MTTPAYLSKDYIRLWDLVRCQRAELHEEGLITNEEYAALVSEEPSKPGTGSPSARRLNSYDELRSDRDDWRQRAEQAQAEVEQARAERDEARHQASELSTAKQELLDEAEATIATLRAELQAAQVMPEALRQAVDDLFVNGIGEQAERLVLTSKDGRDLGGWAKGPILDRLMAATRTQAHPTPAQEV